MEQFNFLEFQITDFLDIVLVALLLFYVYRLVKGSVAINIFIGLVIVWLFWNITEMIGMKMISSIVGGFMQVGFIVLVVVFQQEIRKFLLVLGSTNFASKRNLVKYFKFFKQTEQESRTDISALVLACTRLAQKRNGALIVIENNNSLDFVKNSGDLMNIEVTAEIIESIFYKNSPLHDGAIIVQDNVITATRVILPVSNERKIPLRFGLRHRAAIGISESTDALCLVVSEESGEISYIKNKEFVPYNTKEELIKKIEADLTL